MCPHRGVPRCASSSIPGRDIRSASVGSRPMTNDATADALASGAATLGESGARRMDRRVKPAWSGARVAAPAYPVRCSPGDNLAIHVAVDARAGRIGARRRHGRRARARLLGRGAHHRGRGARHRRPRDRRAACATATRSPRTAFPVFSTGLALHRRDEGATRRGRPAGRRWATWRWTRATGSSATSTAWSSCPVPTLDAVLAAGQARAGEGGRSFADLRGGGTTVEVFGLDTTPRRGRVAPTQ